MDFPLDFTRNILQVFPEGKQWLADLPLLIADLCQQWQLTPGEPFLLSFNYVAPVVRADGTEAVLKIGVPHRELFSEIAAVQLYDGQGMGRLLASKPDQGAMLLERLRPGTMLSEWFDPKDPNGGRDDEATLVLAQTMRALWRPVTMHPSLIPLGDWIAEMRPESPEYPAEMRALRDAALAHYQELHDEAAAVLLHGDLHHFNVLRDGEGWRAIDPKGVIGDALFDVYALLGNPSGLHQVPNLARLTARRMDILAEVLEVPCELIRRWAFIGIVLSTWWNVDASQPDGGGDWQRGMHLARIVQNC